jgi:hypothetical protein
MAHTYALHVPDAAASLTLMSRVRMAGIHIDVGDIVYLSSP